MVSGGVLKVGDDVVLLLSGFETRIVAIDSPNGSLNEAFPPMSVTLRLADDLDVSRGDMIWRAHNAPLPSQNIDAMLCWMSESPLSPGRQLALKHTTRTGRALAKQLQYRLDVNTLHRDEEPMSLRLNEGGRVRLRTTSPLFVDVYRRSRATGGFILIDERTNNTVAAGMVVAAD